MAGVLFTPGEEQEVDATVSNTIACLSVLFIYILQIGQETQMESQKLKIKKNPRILRLHIQLFVKENLRLI